MKLNAELFNEEHSLSLRVEGDKVSAEVDGRSYELIVRENEPNGYLLLDESRVYDCRVPTAKDISIVHLRRHTYPVRIVDPKRLRSTQTAGRHDHGAAEIVAPMPGKVVRIIVAEGAEVKTGDGILVVEAMKMQNELKTPKHGKVASIRAEPGTTVNAGDVLAVIE
jgi:biotin carboxyl carrier protein